MKISPATSLPLILLPLLTLVSSPSPFLNISDTPENMTNYSGLSSEQLERMTQLEQLVEETQQKEEQEQGERALLQQQQQEQARILEQQQNYSTYEDPILGIQIKYPSWWEKIREGDSIGFYDIPMMASVNHFLLPKEMNTLDKFMRQMMTELRSPSEENISVNKTSTIGMDDLPAYRVEWNNVPDPGVQTKRIYYFSIDNSTDTGYMISFTTPLENSQEDIPLFERVVESFKTRLR